MSDQSQGEGWWQAADGKWYPPPRPEAPAPPTTQPFGEPIGGPGAAAYGPPTGPPVGVADGGKKRGIGAGPIIGIVVAVVVILGAIAFFVTRDDDKKQNVIEDEASGVSIAVPQNFSKTDTSRFPNSDAESDFGSQNSDLAPFLSSGNAFLSNSVLAASGSIDGTPAFVVVAKSPQQFDASDSELASELESELRSELGTVGGSDISIDTVTLPAGKALRVKVTLDINTESSSGTVHETIFFVTVGRTTWAILGVTVDGTTGGDVFDQIANSFSAGS